MKNRNTIMKRNFRAAFVAACMFFVGTGHAQPVRHWTLNPGYEIEWKADGKAYSDHIEMSGRQMSVVLRYGVDEQGRFSLNRTMVWPMLRTLPNNTHASLMRSFDRSPLDGVCAGGAPLRTLDERVESICLNGMMTVKSKFAGKPLTLERVVSPSTRHPALIEHFVLTNSGDYGIMVEIPETHTVMFTDASRGVDGRYKIGQTVQGSGCYDLQPGQTVAFSAVIAACKEHEDLPQLDAVQEIDRRRELVGAWESNLELETPDSVVNTMFAFSKIRACESIYATKGGPMHGPGGESYYAAVWANDQAEYINPYFPFVGYDYGNASAMNSFRLFAGFMNEEWKPIPSSIIAEGDDIWNGAGDRGDAAMIAYGAARYALACGSREEAEQLYPLIKWCLAYNKHKLNEDGVVASDADELEGRFPAGDANLCTSSLYYDALVSGAYLAEELGGKSAEAKRYRREAKELERNIDRYFAHEVEGFDTYAYYQGNDVLRSWICIPLTVGINRRAQGTIDALFSPRLWTDDGLLTQAGSSTFWDRSTLYALRGVFMAGEVEKAMKFMKHYSTVRLLGNHVPYAIEAWPEGNQRHLSAESALYGRIITEGLFGIRPTGFRSFTCVPRLPEGWNRMALRHVRAFGADFDIVVEREDAQLLRVTIQDGDRKVLDKTIKSGDGLQCAL